MVAVLAKAAFAACYLESQGSSRHPNEYYAADEEPDGVWFNPVARIEASARGSDVPFVVTNLPGRATLLYERVYCARGRIRIMIKEHKLYTKSARRLTCVACAAGQTSNISHTPALKARHQYRRESGPRRSPQSIRRPAVNSLG
jgi:hypothetical protein